MSKAVREPRPETIWRAPVLTWGVVMILLALNAAMAFAPLGAAKFAVNFIVAGLQVVLVGLFFMRLNRASSLVRLTAVAGLFWLTFLFIMAGTDYLTRP